MVALGKHRLTLSHVMILILATYLKRVVQGLQHYIYISVHGAVVRFIEKMYVNYFNEMHHISTRLCFKQE